MADRQREPALWRELFSYERALLRRAAHAPRESRDPELSRLLAHVQRRRQVRMEVRMEGAAGRGLGSAAPREGDVPTAGETAQGAAELHPRTRTGSKQAAGTLLQTQRVSEDVRILRVARPEGFRFRAGQHMKVGVVGDGRNPYTIASAPGDGDLEFCIERAQRGRVSPRLFALSVGERVALDSRAKGDFALQTDARVHLMVATVAGISPFRSMLRHVAQQDAWPGRFVVLHGASFADELPFRAELEALSQSRPDRLRYIPSVSRPADPRNRSWQGQVGRVADLAPEAARMLQAKARGERLVVYACGNPGMVEQVQRAAGALGLPVATEAFD